MYCAELAHSDNVCSFGLIHGILISSRCFFYAQKLRRNIYLVGRWFLPSCLKQLFLWQQKDVVMAFQKGKSKRNHPTVLTI
jgi:hypothetical protein